MDMNRVIAEATIAKVLGRWAPHARHDLVGAWTPMSMPSMIGLVMLMGIATKNSILLIDYTITAHQQHGLSRKDAVIDACRKRARPIVMTTIAMGAGMLPVALGWGSDPSVSAPMAIVVIGGLISSTFLSLLVIPVVFTCVDDAVQWLRRTAGGSRAQGPMRCDARPGSMPSRQSGH